jgi:hypothetical protein
MARLSGGHSHTASQQLLKLGQGESSRTQAVGTGLLARMGPAPFTQEGSGTSCLNGTGPFTQAVPGPFCMTGAVPFTVPASRVSLKTKPFTNGGCVRPTGLIVCGCGHRRHFEAPEGFPGATQGPNTARSKVQFFKCSPLVPPPFDEAFTVASYRLAISGGL